MQNADKVGDNLIVGAEIDNRTEVSGRAAKTRDVLTEIEQQAVSRMLVVVEGVEGQSVSRLGNDFGAVRQLFTNRQRGHVERQVALIQTVRLEIRRLPPRIGRIDTTWNPKRRRGQRNRSRERRCEVRVDVGAIVQRR